MLKDKINTGSLGFILITQADEKGSWIQMVFFHNMVLYYNKACDLRTELPGFQFYKKSAFDVRGKIVVTCIDCWYWHPTHRSKGIVPERTEDDCDPQITICCNTVTHDTLDS